MCKGDVSLVTFSWVDNDRAPKPNFEVEHECVNWEKMDNWAKDHRFDIFDEKTLVHPSLGTLYSLYLNLRLFLTVCLLLQAPRSLRQNTRQRAECLDIRTFVQIILTMITIVSTIMIIPKPHGFIRYSPTTNPALLSRFNVLVLFYGLKKFPDNAI
jgi:hypothetical protein